MHQDIILQDRRQVGKKKILNPVSDQIKETAELRGISPSPRSRLWNKGRRPSQTQLLAQQLSSLSQVE